MTQATPDTESDGVALSTSDAESVTRYLRFLSEKYGRFATNAEEPLTRGTFRTLATLLAEEALHMERQGAAS